MTRLQHFNIGLDGVVGQQKNYIKSGFRLAYNNTRYEGTAMHTDLHHPEIVPIQELPFDELVQYDARHFPAVRSVFLKHWFSQPESTSLAVIHKGRIAGIGHLRKCRLGYKIGPICRYSRHGRATILCFRKLCRPWNKAIPRHARNKPHCCEACREFRNGKSVFNGTDVHQIPARH